MTGFTADTQESNGASIETVRAGPDYPRLDVEFVVYPERADGQLFLTVDLSRGECDRLMSALADHEGGTYPYPVGTRESVLKALFGWSAPVPGECGMGD